MQKFISVTPEEGRKMIRSSAVLLLPNWDTADAMVFNIVKKKLRIEGKKKRALSVAKYSEDHVALVIWSLKRGSRASYSHTNDSKSMGSLIDKSVEDTPNEEAAKLNVETTTFTLPTFMKEFFFRQDL